MSAKSHNWRLVLRAFSRWQLACCALTFGFIFLSGCHLVDRSQRLNDDTLGEAGQSLRRSESSDESQFGKWGFDSQARDIEKNLGF